LSSLVGEVKRFVVEEVGNVEEFLRLLAPESRVHYELYWRALEYSKEFGIIYKIEAGVKFYGITKEGFILVCRLSEVISWDDERLRKYNTGNLFSDYNEWIKEKWKEFEQKAKELGATPGKFQFAIVGDRA